MVWAARSGCGECRKLVAGGWDRCANDNPALVAARAMRRPAVLRAQSVSSAPPCEYAGRTVRTLSCKERAAPGKAAAAAVTAAAAAVTSGAAATSGAVVTSGASATAAAARCTAAAAAAAAGELGGGLVAFGTRSLQCCWCHPSWHAQTLPWLCLLTELTSRGALRAAALAAGARRPLWGGASMWATCPLTPHGRQEMRG